MELKFIWIEEYKNIKKTGFNFNHSIDEEFEFIDDEIIINPKLNNSPKNFFKDNISSVTAIVGKNGSGKTNLTEFINYNLAHATNGGLSTYIYSKGITILDKWIFVQNEIQINNKDYLKALGYKILQYNDAPLDIGEGEMSWHEMEKNKYIYYNPTFDLRAIPVRDNLVNISTTMLVYNDLYNSEKLYSYSVSEKSSVNQLNAFDSMEKSRICDFILNFDNSNEFIEFIPKRIKFSIDRVENNSFLKKRYFYGEELNITKNKTTNDLQLELDSLERIQFQDYNFEKYFVRQNKNSPLKYYNIPIDEQKSIFFRLFFIKTFQVLLNNDILFDNDYFRKFIYELENDNLKNIKLQKKLLKLKAKVLKIIEIVNWIEFDFPISQYFFGNNNTKEDNIYNYLGSIEILISDNTNKTLLNELIELMDELFKEKRIFNYEFLNEYSSGQKHLLTLYSRFFWAKKQIKKSEIVNYGTQGESIIIFIDEGEVALHPEWQRTFLNNVLKYFKLLFKDYKVQLLITTHSPFVLSDIPKDNIIFLERDEFGNSQILNLEKENTFGANIYSLLSDSFFMNNTIGAFAEEKMKMALEILKSDHTNYSEEVINELKYIINSIGEPIIKEQFEYLFNIKFVIDDIAILRKRIVELENQLKEEKDDFDKN